MALRDLSYDVLTALQSKLEAVQAYNTFIGDCQKAGDDQTRQLFETIKREDERHADQLRDKLEGLVKAGQFR